MRVKIDTNIIPQAPANIEIYEPATPITVSGVEPTEVPVTESDEVVENTEVHNETTSEQEQKVEVDPYAGMSRDERRRAKREAYNKMNQSQSK